MSSPQSPAQVDGFQLGAVWVDLVHRRVRQEMGKELRLTAQEARLLGVLAQGEGRTLGRDEIHVAVWGSPWNGVSRGLDVAIRKLRQKLEPMPRKPRYILSVYGEGYRLAGVDRGEAAAAPQAERRAFVGREAELRSLEALLDEHRVVCVSGPPGVGKSALVREVAARDQRNQWCLPQRARGLTEIWTAALASLGLAARPLAPLELSSDTGWLCVRSERQLVLCLDNLDELTEPELLRLLRCLSVGTELRVVATCRRRAGGLPTLDLAPLSTGSAQELFCALFSRASQQPEVLIPPELASALVRLEGLPGGLAIAARWGGALGLDELHNHIPSIREEQLRGLDLSGSWAQLSSAGRALLTMLAVMSVPVHTSSLEQLGFAQSAWEELAAHGLLGLSGPPADRRCHTLTTVRRAVEALSPGEELVRARLRWKRLVREVAGPARRMLDGVDFAAGAGELRLLRSYLGALAMELGPERSVRAMELLVSGDPRVQDWPGLEPLVEQLQTRARQGQVWARLQLCLVVSRLPVDHLSAGAPQLDAGSVERIAAFEHELGPLGAARLADLRRALLLAAGEQRLASEQLSCAARAFDEAGAPALANERDLHRVLAFTQFNIGRVAGILDGMRARSTGDVATEGATLAWLWLAEGWATLVAQGDHGGMERMELARKLFQRIEHRTGAERALFLRVEGLYRLGDLERCLALIRAQLELAEVSARRALVPGLLAVMARCQIVLGRPDQARRAIAGYRRELERRGDELAALRADLLSGQLELLIGDRTQAENHLLRVAALAPELAPQARLFQGLFHAAERGSAPLHRVFYDASPEHWHGLAVLARSLELLTQEGRVEPPSWQGRPEERWRWPSPLFGALIKACYERFQRRTLVRNEQGVGLRRGD